MAIFLFLMLTVKVSVNMIQIFVRDFPGAVERLGWFLGTLLWIAPYVWFGWYSGHVF